MFTKYIISLFLVICILISCISFSYASELPDSDNDNLNIYGRMTFQGMRSDPPNAGDWVDITTINQQLPALQTNNGIAMYNDIGAFRLSQLQISTSQSGYYFKGYYSIYLQLSFYCSDSTEYFDFANSLSAFQHISITTETSTYYAKVQFNKNNNDSYIWYDGLNYIQTFLIKIDFKTNGTYSVLNIGDTGLPYLFQSNSQTGKKWLVICDNFSVVKYKNEQQFSQSETLLEIASNLSIIKNDIPQIIQYLANIYQSQDELETLLSTTNNSLDQIYNFLVYNLGTANNYNTLYRFIYNLYVNLLAPGRNYTDSPYYYLFYFPYGFQYFEVDASDPDDEGSILSNYSQNLRGLIRGIYGLLNSINQLLLFDYKEKQETINSAGYQAGSNVSSNINSYNGFGTLSNFSSSASGFGNISIIGNIFNGLGTAFRWFSTQTKNNLDNVPSSRRHNDIVTNYYQSGLDEANQYLYPNTSESSEVDD